MRDVDRSRDVDVTAGITKETIPEATRDFFVERRPERISPMSVPTLRDHLDPDSAVEYQRELYEYVDEIVTQNRRRDVALPMSRDLEVTQHEFIQRYAHSIPTDEALAYLCDHSPLVELFAGNGYWASELDRVGCEITAYDADPPRSAWTDVTKGTQDALLDHGEAGDVSLVVCWPPIGPAAYEALLIARPAEVFFIGERPGDGFKMMGDETFFQSLAARYEQVNRIELPRLMGHMDALHHFIRC